MFRALSYQCKLKKLQNRKRQIYSEHGKSLAQAHREERKPEDIYALWSGMEAELKRADAAVLWLQSEYLLQEAERLLVPTPPFNTEDGVWEEGGPDSLAHLSLKAAAELRAAIRKEKKERADNLRAWAASIAGVVGALTGVVGALIGLITSLHSYRAH